ncbi:carboxyl transferase domain-containing protein [Iamia majanohamensis]|uniref:Carboxyl transferase domain-containing protein n=1 Tax=Iamia majanohamensis TaxID=467976 RepID=A0AAE9YEQ9_9ACTN|nr:carboxyl transferase domain-containing protein [Iamia majanohamensis]WCO66521.1 carboxyl transferase domain-containing protein [Iamia majanohamensis]
MAGTDLTPVPSPLQGQVVEVRVAVGDAVHAGQVVAVVESMKMHHDVTAPEAGVVASLAVAVDDQVAPGDPVAVLRPGGEASGTEVAGPDLDLDAPRADLEEVRARHRVGSDEGRAEAVAKRHARGRRTARENVADLVDEGSFVEYGPLAIAAQRRRRDLEDLIARTPADGLVGGVARVNGDLVDPDRSRAVVASYDYTVLAGTQGYQNHRKKDRLFALAEEQRLPIVLFAEGGGGRPGDTDTTTVSGLDCLAFHLFGRLSGTVPLVGIGSGRCFAGNAALLGCCDVVIATEDANIGMGGPAMIEGGGLGTFAPEDIGPIDVQDGNGVVDVRVADDAAAVAAARRYLSYFQGPVAPVDPVDPRTLRHLVPEDRLKVYDVRAVLDALVDEGSRMELRQGFAKGMVTSLARIEGQPLGIVANDPAHLGGAIDSDCSDKAARFLQLCDAHGLPVLFACDTPGFMVGPASEETASVRHMSRLFVTGANLSVPCATVILRKAYGLGAQTMAAGSFKAPAFVVAWPTGELGGMGLEGAVRLGFRDELARETDDEAREALFQQMVAAAYEHGKGINVAAQLEIDDVIDPADTRRWITTALLPAPLPPDRPRRPRRPHVDTW